MANKQELEIIKLAYEVLGNGFSISEDREGWCFSCPECEARCAGDDGQHEEDCKTGKLIKAIDGYLYNETT